MRAAKLSLAYVFEIGEIVLADSGKNLLENDEVKKAFLGGYRLRRQFGFDQIERAFTALDKNPDSRQIVLEIWDSKEDFPAVDGSPVAKDIPCNVCSMLKVRDGRLEWMQIMRSNDLFLGTPHNFVQFNLSITRFRDLCALDDLPEAYRNLIFIVAADAARRRMVADGVRRKDWNAIMDRAAASCTNPVLRLAWEGWRQWRQ